MVVPVVVEAAGQLKKNGPNFDTLIYSQHTEVEKACRCHASNVRLTDPENAKDFHSELNKCELGSRVFSQGIPKDMQFDFKD